MACLVGQTAYGCVVDVRWQFERLLARVLGNLSLLPVDITCIFSLGFDSHLDLFALGLLESGKRCGHPDAFEFRDAAIPVLWAFQQPRRGRL